MKAHRGGDPDDLNSAEQPSNRRLVIPPRPDRSTDVSTSMLRMVLEQLPLAVAIYDRDRRYQFVSDDWLKQLGVVREAMLGRRDEDVFGTDSTARYLPLLAACQSTGQPQSGEFALSRDVSGMPPALITLAIRYVPIFDESNALVAIAALRDDITRHVHTERAAQQLAAMSHSFSYAIFSAALNGTILSWNGGAERIYGYRAEEAIGRSLAFLTPESDQEQLRSRLRAVASGEVIDGIEVVQIAKSGEPVYVAASISPIWSGAGTVTGAACIAHDVSFKRALERRMSAASRMEGVGRLTDSVAHDLNNLLTIVQSYATFIVDDAPSPEVASDADVIQKSAMRGSALVAQLLAFSRKQVQAPKTIDLNDVVRELDKLLQHVVNARYTLVLELAPEPVCVLGDQAELEQVLLSLVLYARDTLPETGQITITTRTVSNPESEATRSGRLSVLTVKDTGEGLDPETCKHLFDPFYVAKDGHDIGLGLSTARQLVRQKNGDIHVTSERGVGTEFSVQFFAIQEPRKVSENQTGSLRDLAGGETVLLIEQDTFLRTAMLRTLEKSGYSVLEAATGEHALRLAKDHSAAIHGIIANFSGSSRLNGPEYVRKIVSTHPETRILYTSEQPDDALLRASLADLPSIFLARPFASEHLLGELRRLFDTSARSLSARSEPVIAPHSGAVLALIVDDQDEIRESLQRLLAECDITTVSAKSGLHAMQRLKELSIDIVIADHFMPGMDGIRLLESIRSLYPEVVRVLYTGHASSEIVMDAINRGGVHKVLPKTMHPISVRDHIQDIANDVLERRALNRGI